MDQFYFKDLVLIPQENLKVKKFWHEKYKWQCDLKIRKRYKVKNSIVILKRLDENLVLKYLK